MVNGGANSSTVEVWVRQSGGCRAMDITFTCTVYRYMIIRADVLRRRLGYGDHFVTTCVRGYLYVGGVWVCMLAR